MSKFSQFLLGQICIIFVYLKILEVILEFDYREILHFPFISTFNFVCWGHSFPFFFYSNEIFIIFSSSNMQIPEQSLSPWFWMMSDEDGFSSLHSLPSFSSTSSKPRVSLPMTRLCHQLFFKEIQPDNCLKFVFQFYPFFRRFIQFLTR